MTPCVPRPVRRPDTAAAPGVRGTARASLLGAALCVSLGAAAQDGKGGAALGHDPRAATAIVGASTAPGFETRVVGGERASIVDWPSVVALLRLRPDEARMPFDRQFCGGTVIAPRWVLTAAHCLFDPFGAPMESSELTVLAGQTNLREPSEGREVTVVNVIRHPGYVNDDPTGRTKDDIALLELATDVPAPASELFAGDPERYAGRRAAIVGWGALEYTEIGDPPFPDELQRGVVPIVPFETCNGPEGYDGDVAENQFCAGLAEGGVDACTGDSGGPLYLTVEDRVQVVGVTSFGRGCALPGFYGIYTDVAAYLDWVTTYVDLSITPAPPMERALADAGGGGSGALGPATLLLLLLAPLVRRRRRGLARAGASADVRPRRRGARRRGAVTGAVLCAAASTGGCTGTSGGGSPGAGGADAAPSPEPTVASALARDALVPGLSRTETLTRLRAIDGREPACESAKFAVPGTGRAFARERCRLDWIEPSPVSLAGPGGADDPAGRAPLATVQVELVDDVAVRVDLVLEAGAPALDATDPGEPAAVRTVLAPDGRQALVLLDPRADEALPALADRAPPGFEP